MRGKFFLLFIFFFLNYFTSALVCNISSYEEVEQLLQDHSIVILFIDPHTRRIIGANQSALDFYGYSYEKIRSLYVQDINTLELTEIDRHIEEARAQRREFFTFQHRLANGDIRDVEVHSSLITINNKSVFFSVVHDITERVQASSLLRESEQRLLRAEEIAGFGHWFMDLEKKVMYGSKGALDIYGFPDGMTSISEVQDSALPEYREYLNEALSNLISGEQPYDVSFRIRNRLDNRLLNIHSVAEYDPEQNIVFGIIRDITSEVAAQEALRRRTSLLYTVLIAAIILQFFIIYYLIISKKKLKAIRHTLEQSEQNYRFLTENTPECVWLYDLIQDKFKYISPSVEKLRGIPSEIAIHETVYDSFTRESARFLQHKLEAKAERIKLGAPGETIYSETYELKQLTATGEVIDVEVSTNFFYDKQSGHLEVLGITRDITEKVQHKKELEETLKRYKNQQAVIDSIIKSKHIENGDLEKLVNELTRTSAKAFDAERISVWLFDKSLKNLFCLDLYERSINCHRKGMELNREQYGPEFKAFEQAMFIDADDPCNDPRTAGYVESYIKPLNITSMLDASIWAFGRVQGVLSIEHVGKKHSWTQDEITFACQLAEQIALTMVNEKRRQAEYQLSQQTNKLEKILETIPDLLFIIDKTGTFVDFFASNPEALAIPPDKIIGSHLSDLYGEQDYRRIMSLITEALSKQEIKTYEYTLKIENSLRYYEARINPVDHRHILAIVRDITTIKEAEKQLVEKNKDLEELTYATSHDLRTPLINIEGFTQELMISIKDISDTLHHHKLSKDEIITITRDSYQSLLDTVENDIYDSINYIKSSTNKMDLLIKGLLSYSRLNHKQITITEIDMTKAINSVKLDFDFELNKKGITLEVAELPHCYADEFLVNHTFSNLIENAIKYLKKGVKGVIKIYGQAQDEYSVYYVEDNGIGIAEKFHDKIFLLFHRLEPTVYSGEGLGLSIAKKNVHLLQGSIGLQSEPGKGSIFYVKLPNYDYIRKG